MQAAQQLTHPREILIEVFGFFEQFRQPVDEGAYARRYPGFSRKRRMTNCMN
jgi:hypothetical protein